MIVINKVQTCSYLYSSSVSDAPVKLHFVPIKIEYVVNYVHVHMWVFVCVHVCTRVCAFVENDHVFQKSVFFLLQAGTPLFVSKSLHECCCPAVFLCPFCLLHSNCSTEIFGGQLKIFLGEGIA